MTTKAMIVCKAESKQRVVGAIVEFLSNEIMEIACDPSVWCHEAIESHDEKRTFPEIQPTTSKLGKQPDRIILLTGGSVR